MSKQNTGKKEAGIYATKKNAPREIRTGLFRFIEAGAHPLAFSEQ